MIDVDITSDLTYILSLLAQGFNFCFNFLSSIKFMGTNLLSFSISILVIGVVCSLIFSRVSTRLTDYSEVKIRKAYRNYNEETSTGD